MPPTTSATTALNYPSSSTSDAGKDVLSAATSAAGSVYALDVADRIRRESNWRWQYHRHAVEHVRVCADAPPDGCLDVARAGLERLYETFRYDDGGGEGGEEGTGQSSSSSLREALAKRLQEGRQQKRRFVTGRAVGTEQRPQPPRAVEKGGTGGLPDLALPIRGRTLRGPEVHAQMDRWAQKGVVEPDTAAAVRGLRPDDLNLADSDWVFVVMGAGAAMGPLQTLLSLGATVIAVDLPIPAVWERLMRTTKDSPGTIIFPMRDGDVGDGSTDQSMALRAGCNLLTEITELINWLVEQCPSKRLVLGSYAYLDSAAFVRVSLAMDAVASETLKVRPDSALAYLCSPTDVFAIPPAARDAAARRCANGGTAFQNLVSTLAPADRILDPNVVGPTRDTAIPLVDALVLQQGPNYFLAKRLQHWRAMVSRADLGTVVSSNVAPASNTTSVLKNKLLAAAYAGAHHFAPIEIFDPETSNVLMTYLLLHDLRVGAAGGPTPQQRAGLVDHPLNLFATTPVHNGIWRCGFQIRSLLELVLGYYILDQCQAPAVVTVAALGVGTAVLRSRL